MPTGDSLGFCAALPVGVVLDSKLGLCRGAVRRNRSIIVRSGVSSVACTLRVSSEQEHLSKPSNLILGLNQYSHDASIAVVDADSGELVYALSKERLTRRKHDAGSVGGLVRHALLTISGSSEESFDADLWYNAVSLVVANNHHFRIQPFEAALPFSVGAGFCPPSYGSPWNLIGRENQKKLELSHHLAHVHSAIRNAPFHEGLVVVCDGMGDSRDMWSQTQASYHDREISDNGSRSYHHDLHLAKDPDFREFPAEAASNSSSTTYREAESAYLFRRSAKGLALTRLFKRWTREVSPSELYNHGFHDMESVGAVYSRCASHIFGDWNACGKVMGLAPWVEPEAQPLQELMSGSLYNGTLSINSELMATLPHVNQWAEDIFSLADDEIDPSDRGKLNMYRNLASRVQSDLERVVLQFLRDLKDASGACNLVFAGGVALNSTLNGRILRESGFDHVYIPAHPGDEGIAIGCALFGFERHSRDRNAAGGMSSSEARKSPARFSPYLGPFYSVSKIMSALRRHESWITWDVISNRAAMVGEIVDALCDGQVVALFQGRSEAGPRALGNRSLLADPRGKEMAQRLNHVVKKRESFRPFAPTCLDEFVRDYFDEEQCQERWSPYMSITSGLLKPHLTPAVSHVDGTARVQTLSRDANPFYYDLIQGFHERSGIPMLLNTSFNVAGEPIVENCTDALQTFLGSSGIDALVFSDAGAFVRARASSPGNREDDNRMVCLGKMAKNFRSHTTRSADGEVIRVAISTSSWLASSTEEDDGFHDDDAGWVDEGADGRDEKADDDRHSDGDDNDEGEDEGDQERILREETGRAVSMDDLYMDDLSRAGEGTVDLEDERELGILEALACQDGPITVSQVFKELQQVGMLADEEEEEEGAEEDDKDNVRAILERMWARRLVQIAAPSFASATAASG